jgi:hypothetical protein
MRNRFDYLSKRIGKDALGRSGTIVAGDAITTETQYADLRHEPDPARQAERDRLGLLGRLAAFPCLLEAYSKAPQPEDFRACLTKHLAHWQDCARQARAGNHTREPDEPPEKVVAPFLWIIAAGAPNAVLGQLKFEAAPTPEWPKGVYFFGGDVLHVGIVVASELLRDDPSTLLVRIMAGGKLLPQAVKEVRALPADAPERVIAEPALLDFEHEVGQAPEQTEDEKEFIVAMQRSWENARAEGRTEESERCSTIRTEFRRGHLVCRSPEPFFDRWGDDDGHRRDAGDRSYRSSGTPRRDAAPSEHDLDASCQGVIGRCAA